MKAVRKLMLPLCISAWFLSGGVPALAQEPEQKQETGSEEAPQQEREADPQGPAEEDKKPETQEPRPEAPKPGPGPLVEKVKVTATRVETELMKTPIAISVFDQDELDREGVQNLRDMAQMVPNMDIATINGQSTPIISMRGVRSTNETELGDSSVGVHLDGVYSPRMQGILGIMFDNERVEVSRGPQGTLFGRNSTVGSINIIPAKPKLDAYDANWIVRAGNWNSRVVAGMVNVPVNEKLGFRFAARTLQSDSYIDGYWDPNQYDQRRIAHLVDQADVISSDSLDPDTGQTLCTSPRCYSLTQRFNWWSDTANGGNGYDIRELVSADPEDFYFNADEWAYRLSALWKPHEKVSIDLSTQRYKSDGAGGIDLINCERLRGRPRYEPVFYEAADPSDPLNGTITGYVQTGVNDCTGMFPRDDTYQAVVSTPGRFFLDIDYWRSRVAWDINDDLSFIYTGGGEDMDRESAQDMEQALNAWDQAMYFLPGTGAKSWSHEVQLQSQGRQNFNWIAGANVFREKTSTIGYFDNTISVKDLWDQPNRSTRAGALFAQGTYSYSPKWHLTLGYRYSRERKRDIGGRTYTCNANNGCAPQVDRENIAPGVYGFERQSLSEVPIGYFADPANYPTFQANDNRGKWSHNDFRVGLDYDKSENTLLYAYLATGFKAGGIGDVIDVTNPRTGEIIHVETRFDQEEVTNLEFGFKSQLWNGKLNLTGNYFYADYEDMQYASVAAIGFTEEFGLLYDDFGNPIPSPFGGFLFGWVRVPIVAYYTQNVPGAQIQGFEFEYDWRPWPGGKIKGYASWLDTKITEDWWTIWSYDARAYLGGSWEQSIDPTNENLYVNLKGNELAVSPPLKLHLTVDHAFLMPGGRTTIIPWVTAHWEAASYLTVWNVEKHVDDLNFVILSQDIHHTDDKREPWSMLHGGLRIYHGNWSVEFYGYNLTDEVVQWWGGAAEYVTKGSMSVPRNYGFHVGLKF